MGLTIGMPAQMTIRSLWRTKPLSSAIFTAFCTMSSLSSTAFERSGKTPQLRSICRCTCALGVTARIACSGRKVLIMRGVFPLIVGTTIASAFILSAVSYAICAIILPIAISAPLCGSAAFMRLQYCSLSSTVSAMRAIVSTASAG